MKKFVCFLASLSLILGGFTVAFAAADNNAAAADTAPATMEFAGTPINLSLEQAIERMTSAGPAFEGVELAKKGNEAAAKGQFELISAIEDLESVIKYADDATKEALRASGTPTSMKTLTGKQATLAKSFYQKYSPVAYEAGINGLKNQTIQTYYGLLMIQEQYRISKETTAVKNTLFNNTKKKFDLGLVSKLEVLQAENAYISAKKDEANALTLLKTTKMGLNMAFNYDLMQDVQLTDSLVLIEAPSIDLDKAIKSALANRSEIMKAKYEMEKASIAFDAVGAYPSNSATYMGQEAAYKGAQLAYDTTLLSVEMGIRTAYMELQDLAQAVTLANSTYENAKEAARLSELQYNAGMSTLTDLQTVQNMAALAQVGVYKAIMDYDLAVYSFEYATGAGVISSSGM